LRLALLPLPLLEWQLHIWHLNGSLFLPFFATWHTNSSFHHREAMENDCPAPVSSLSLLSSLHLPLCLTRWQVDPTCWSIPNLQLDPHLSFFHPWLLPHIVHGDKSSSMSWVLSQARGRERAVPTPTTSINPMSRDGACEWHVAQLDGGGSTTRGHGACHRTQRLLQLHGETHLSEPLPDDSDKHGGSVRVTWPVWVVGYFKRKQKNSQAHGYRCSFHLGVFQGIDFARGTRSVLVVV
jgi:hypothetical protein